LRAPTYHTIGVNERVAVFWILINNQRGLTSLF
jgi:hypothetical protein